MIFGAFIALNEKRVQEQKHWLTCRKIKTKEEAKSENHKTPYLLCCTGKPPKSRAEAESLLDKFPRWLLPKIVLVTPLKILICLIFIGYLAGAIYGCINLKQGLRFSELPSDTSYYYAYAATEENFLPRQTPVPFIITQHYNYSESLIQQTIESFMTKVKGEDLFEPDFEVNWLKTYISTPYYTNASEEAFIVGLEAFLNNSLFSSFKNDVVIDSSRTKIIASRFYGRSRDLEGSQEEGDLMLRSRELADDFELECFAFYPIFILFEQYVLVFPQTMLTVGIALIVVLVITCFFMPHPVLILFCTIAVALIMTGVFGYMYYIDVSLSAITMVQIIMGIGFSVDFTAHICHGYMASPGETRNIRVKGAIDKTGSPITHGAISSLLGIAFLGAAQSYIFRTFAAVVAFVLSFGWAHALLLLPVVLSWIGPGHFKSKKSSKTKKESSKKYEDSYYTGNVYLPKHNNSNGVGYRLSNNDQNISMIELSNGGPGISDGMIPNGAPTAPIKNGIIANGELKLSSEYRDAEASYKDKGKGKHSDHIRKGDVKGKKEKSKDKENDKNLYDFDQKSSVFKIYPDIWTGDYHWETMSTKPREWTKKMKY